MSENPNTVHGRLLEAVHISGYSFERACSELEWLLKDNRWMSVGGGFDDINAFLKTIDFSEFRIAVDQRKKLANRLHEIEASQRTAAKVLGVGRATIQRDIGGSNGPPPPEKIAENGDYDDTSGSHGPPEWFSDDKLNPARLAKGRANRKKRDEEAEKLRTVQIQNTVTADNLTKEIRFGDFRETLKDLENVDAIITDPPYGKDYLPLLGDLAAWADNVLKKNGVLAVLFGQTHLSEAYRLLDVGRPYRWTMAYLTPGPGYVSHARKVQSQWKPVLIYGDGPRFSDVINSQAIGGGVGKTHHEWEQSLGAFQEIIERLTAPGDLVVDPFAGAGTTLLAALSCGRGAIGAEISKEHYETAKTRLGK